MEEIMYLTKRQRQILEYLKKYIAKMGYSPTFEEIGKHFKLNSKGTVYKHLQNLEKKGVILKDWNRQRSIQVLSHLVEATNVTLPLVGIIKAGSPVETFPHKEQISVPSHFVGMGKHYVLKVSGNSMIDERIQDGDFVVIKQQIAAENGQTVVALVNNTEVTLKKFYKENDHIRLQPANSELSPIILDSESVSIQGIVVGVMRKYN